MMSNDLSVAFHTLGCKVNHHDSDVMKGLFQSAGYKVVDFAEQADVYVINTCTVTHLSDRKSRQMIRRAAQQNPKAVIAVCGCYVQASPDEVKALAEVDIILGTNERSKIVEAVETFMKDGKKASYLPDQNEFRDFEEIKEARVSDMTRAYLKVQEGCEQFCTYCIIPYARGPLRSRSAVDVVSSIRTLEKQGYNEVILTGIHLGAYGCGEHDEPMSLAELCRIILNQTTIKRIRLSSIEPTEITDNLLELMTIDERLARHLHIPLQSGTDTILERMNRPYKTAEFADVVTRIRKSIPDIAITTDIIVGFPGENKVLFEETCAFVKKMNFSGMHIFKYSPRKGTPAADYTDRVTPEAKNEYSAIMHEIAREKELSYQKQHIGKIVEVLIEEKTEHGFTGHTSNYLRVYTNDEVILGTFVKIKLTDLDEKGLHGSKVKESV